MGWHTRLFRRCLDVAAGVPTVEPVGDELMLDHGTSNFQWMAAAGWWGWALAAGNEEKAALAADRILALYAEEKRVGHQLREQTCPMPHDTFHRVAHAAIFSQLQKYAAATKRHLSSTEERIIAENNAWWAWRLALDHAGATPDGQVILPGCRGDGAPLSQIADAIYRMARGLPQRGPATTEAWWANPIYGGGAPSIMKGILGPGPWKFEMPALPKLRLPMTVEKDQRGFRASLGGRDDSQPVISAVTVEYGAVGHHRITFVKNWDDSTRETI